MTIAALLAAVLQYGPSIVPLVQKLVGDIAAGRAQQNVTPEDLAELVRLSQQSSADIWARLGIQPPPAAPGGN